MTHESSAALEAAPPWQQHLRDPPLSSCALPAPSSSWTTVVYLWIIFFPARFFHLFNSSDQSTVSRLWLFLKEEQLLLVRARRKEHLDSSKESSRVIFAKKNKRSLYSSLWSAHSFGNP